MELHRIIFRVDFPPAFKLFNRWGDALEILNASKFWTQVGDTKDARMIVAERKEVDKGIHHNLMLQVNSVNGSIEEHPIKSVEAFDKPFANATQLVHLVEASAFVRLGVRFVFLEPTDTFEAARRALANQLRDEYVGVSQGDLTDLSLTTVYKHEDQFLRLTAGPVQKKEYVGWFTVPDNIQIENGFLVDIDCYSFEYKFKTFDLRKLIDFAHTSAKKQAADLVQFLKGKVN
jgi:hypothetical protein